MKLWDDFKIMEPVYINHEELFSNCEYVAESKSYLFYSYHSTKNNARGYYLIRVTKRNPREMLYFGERASWCCVFHEYLFCIDRKSPFFSDLILEQIDVSTGRIIKHSIFGKGRVVESYEQDSAFEICQDSVQNMHIENDRLVLTVHRKEGRLPSGVIEENNTDLDYRIEVFFEHEKLKYKSIFPERSRMEEGGSKGKKGFRDSYADSVDLSEKYQIVQAAVEQIITEREEAGCPAGANYKIAYFIMFVNILKEISIFTERESVMLVKQYRLNEERQLFTEGVAAIRIIENAYAKIRRETDQEHAVERFALYIEHIFSQNEEPKNAEVNKRIQIVTRNVKYTLSALTSTEEERLSSDGKEAADSNAKIAESAGTVSASAGKPEEEDPSDLNEEEKLYNILKQNVTKYAKFSNHPSAQEILASMVITYASASPRDENHIFSASEISYSETIIYTTFYVLCHILNRTTEKDLRTSDMNVFFSIIVKEVIHSTSFIAPNKMINLWKDRWVFYNSLMDQSGDLYKYLFESSNAFSVFLKFDRNHYPEYRDGIITAETILQSDELDRFAESVQEQISIDSYIYSLESVFEAAIQDVLEEF